MSTKRILTVFGATGNQGGSVLNTILNHPTLRSKYTLRGISRDTTKPASQSLTSRGVEVVQADLSSPASIRAAIAGSTAVFAVTNYWESASKDIEFAQGKTVVDACLAENVRHLVWSSLPNVTALTNGELKMVEHFDTKAAVQEHAERVSAGSGSKLVVSYFQPGFFMSNMKTMMMQYGDVWMLNQPWDAEKTHVPMLDTADDTGKFVVGLLEAGESAKGVVVHGVSEWKTPNQIVNDFAAVTGSKAAFQEIGREQYKSYLPMEEKVKEELTQNMELIKGWSYYGKGTETEKVQSQSDKWLVQGAQKTTWKQFVKREGLGKAQA